MIPQPYSDITDQDLLALCIYREARGEGLLGKRGVAWTVLNRVKRPSWWGTTIREVILHKWQFSSFNEDDPNSDVWPRDTDPVWVDCVDEAGTAISGESQDPTSGAVYYFSPPLTIPPHAWGNVQVLIKIGNLTFCK